MSDSHIDKIHINKIHSCNNDPKYRQVWINSRVSVKGSLGVIYSQKSPLNVQIWMDGSVVLVIIKYIVT